MAPLRVVSYNVRYFGHGTRGLASTAAAMRRIAHALATLDPLADIVCLQEVETTSLRSTVAHPKSRDGETQLECLMEMLEHSLARAGKPDAYEAYYFPAHAYQVTARTHIYTTGLAILAHRRFRVDHHNSLGPADITHRHIHAVRRLKQTRICAHLRFTDLEGQIVDVFNTHLSLPTALSRDFWTRPARMGYGPNQLEEAKNLARFIENERRGESFFIAGDFNSLPGSPVYQYLTGELGYRDPFAQLHKMNEDELRAWPTAGFMRLRMHLDHIFSGPALRWVDFEDSHPFGHRAAAFHGLSDHVPMIGRCRVGGSHRTSKRPLPASAIRAEEEAPRESHRLARASQHD
jgi:endonuclease/exonuclease/phosphatase family metal-dependent hydrolase